MRKTRPKGTGIQADTYVNARWHPTKEQVKYINGVRKAAIRMSRSNRVSTYKMLDGSPVVLFVQKFEPGTKTSK